MTALALEEQLNVAKKQAAENYDRLLRAVADLDNYRKRAQREKEELRQFAVTSLTQDLLPVLDNISLGLSAARNQTEVKGFADGMALVLEQLKNTLAKHGLKEVNPLGELFDPHLHESIAHQPDDRVPEEHVAKVVRPGYTLNGRLLRPAAVVLSSGAANKQEGKS
ncbi:MAG: nucleotide exchange factor GrpE [Opitutaceae bacterium]|nr:nucleotide exchange factor GrpE [Opitutaceae bacterium]